MDTTMNHFNADVTLETSATTGALDEALAKAQGEIDIASKDSVNPAFRSKYANLTSVWEACRPALAKNSIALTQWPLAEWVFAFGASNGVTFRELPARR